MNFQDIFKNSFLERAETFSIVDTVLSLILAFVLGLFIYFVYRRTYRGVVFSPSFGVSLVALTMISTLVLLAVTANVVLSLGMVGALSIVRFRTAVKDPLDIVFLFWAIGVGIVLGACIYPLAIIGSLIIGIILLIFIRGNKNPNQYMLILECSEKNMEQTLENIVKRSTARYSLKAKTISAAGCEITYTVSLKDKNAEFLDEITALNGIDKAVLVSYSGEYTE